MICAGPICGMIQRCHPAGPEDSEVIHAHWDRGNLEEVLMDLIHSKYDSCEGYGQGAVEGGG